MRFSDFYKLVIDCGFEFLDYYYDDGHCGWHIDSYKAFTKESLDKNMPTLPEHIRNAYKPIIEATKYEQKKMTNEEKYELQLRIAKYLWDGLISLEEYYMLRSKWESQYEDIDYLMWLLNNKIRKEDSKTKYYVNKRIEKLLA